MPWIAFGHRCFRGRETRDEARHREPRQGFLGAYRHRQYTVPLCLGVRDPGIAELRSTRVARGVSEPESRLTGHPQPTNYNEKLELAAAAL